MKLLPIAISFVAGFVLATIIGLTVVLPIFRDGWQTNLTSDVHLPLQMALQDIERSATEEHCEKTAVQLRVLNKRFEEYRLGGPTPADWRDEIQAATQPAR